MEEAVASLAQLNPRRFQRLSQRIQVGGRQLHGRCRAHSLRNFEGNALRCKCKPHSPDSGGDEIRKPLQAVKRKRSDVILFHA